MSTIWPHVTPQSPCPICSKPDWCQVGEFGFRCYRVESVKPFKSGGWFHPFGSHEQKPRHVAPVSKPQTIDAEKMYYGMTQPESHEMESFATQLGVRSHALYDLGCVWSPKHNAWAFPMCDGDGKIIGIRLRWNDGTKKAVTGSRSGIFIPTCEPADMQRTAYLVEGPTDAAAGLSLGYYTIGRPNNIGGGAQIKRFMQRMRISMAVVVADNDDAGQVGAEMIAKEINVRCCIYTPSSKDLRSEVEYLRLLYPNDSHCESWKRCFNLIKSSTGNFIWRKYS